MYRIRNACKGVAEDFGTHGYQHHTEHLLLRFRKIPQRTPCRGRRIYESQQPANCVKKCRIGKTAVKSAVKPRKVQALSHSQRSLAPKTSKDRSFEWSFFFAFRKCFQRDSSLRNPMPSVVFCISGVAVCCSSLCSVFF